MNPKKSIIYLDNNASAPLLPPCAEMMSSFFKNPEPLNPSSMHLLGQKARGIIEDARTSILQSIFPKNHKEYQLIFTSSATEANNQIINTFKNNYVLFGATEHPSITKPAKILKENFKIPSFTNGLVNGDFLVDHIKKTKHGNFLTSISLSNSETGIIQTELESIIKEVHSYGGLFHSDYSQIIGRYSAKEAFSLNLDYITISSHKCGGPTGIAALIYKKNAKMPTSLLLGGSQEFGLRASTENTIATKAFALALKESINLHNARYKQIEEIRNRMESRISNLGGTIIGKNQKRLCNTSMISMPNAPRITQIANFDTHNIMVGSGSACSSGNIQKINTLTEMNVKDEIGNNAIRVSTFFQNTPEELESFTNQWESVFLKSNKKG